MLDSISELVQAWKRAFGIFGDSLTFLGGLLLALEALYKKSDRQAIEDRQSILDLFPTAQDENGNPLSISDLDKSLVSRWQAIARLGVVIMVLGFLCLLLLRIFAE